MICSTASEYHLVYQHHISWTVPLALPIISLPHFTSYALNFMCFSWSIIIGENWWIAPKSRKTRIFHGFLSGTKSYADFLPSFKHTWKRAKIPIFIFQIFSKISEISVFSSTNLVFRNTSIRFWTNSIKHGSDGSWSHPIYAKFVINVSANTMDWRWGKPRQKIHQHAEVSIDIVSIDIGKANESKVQMK